MEDTPLPCADSEGMSMEIKFHPGVEVEKEGVEITHALGDDSISLTALENKIGELRTDSSQTGKDDPVPTIQPHAGAMDVGVVERKPSPESTGTQPKNGHVETSLTEVEGEGSCEMDEDRERDWQSRAPQLGTLAQAVMAATLISGTASSKTAPEDVFGDISDEDM